ncbi:hypothetical protein Cob_v012251 [Colletotrichum orbiculare MAFF 240422]|uniref:Uncharacterized protein n=1 Tax=Colletotrichum orbiculare (strain 104-T / ATCC 96160 / CBS 514.97 / LARS 414 / MAFF 240422) TaxID=1213857 RepID=A0A484FBJ2_COLOR|nr:hypothetical protein Cob_v012251 [Colletotrichum orbiculare MAFF 240422]
MIPLRDSGDIETDQAPSDTILCKPSEYSLLEAGQRTRSGFNHLAHQSRTKQRSRSELNFQPRLQAKNNLLAV